MRCDKALGARLYADRLSARWGQAVAIERASGIKPLLQ
jgi:hypothetical protein